VVGGALSKAKKKKKKSSSAFESATPLPNLAGLSLPTGVDPPDASAAAASTPARDEFAALREESSVLFVTLMRALLGDAGSIGDEAFCRAMSAVSEVFTESEGRTTRPKGGPTEDAYELLYEELEEEGLIPHPVHGVLGPGESFFNFFARVCRAATLLRYEAYIKRHFAGLYSLQRPDGLLPNNSNLGEDVFAPYRMEFESRMYPPLALFNGSPDWDRIVDPVFKKWIQDPDFAELLLSKAPDADRVPTWLDIYIVHAHKHIPHMRAFFTHSSSRLHDILAYSSPEEIKEANDNYNASCLEED